MQAKRKQRLPGEFPVEFFGKEPAPVRKGKLHLVSVVQDLGGSNDRCDLRFACARNMPQALYYVSPFPEKLCLVRDILPLAPSANSKMRADWRPIVGRLGKRLDDPCLGVVSFFPYYASFHHLPGNGMVQEDYEPVHFCYGFTSKRELFNLKLYISSFDYLFHYSPGQFQADWIWSLATGLRILVQLFSPVWKGRQTGNILSRS